MLTMGLDEEARGLGLGGGKGHRLGPALHSPLLLPGRKKRERWLVPPPQGHNQDTLLSPASSRAHLSSSSFFRRMSRLQAGMLASQASSCSSCNTAQHGLGDGASTLTQGTSLSQGQQVVGSDPSVGQMDEDSGPCVLEGAPESQELSAEEQQRRFPTGLGG